MDIIMCSVLDFVKRKTEEGFSVCLVTVTKTNGSSPASIGQMLAVCEDGSNFGTVGGGATEFKIITQAIEAIKNGHKLFNFYYDHSENGMVCGGSMEGFGTIFGNENHIYIFGGGHIAQSFAKVATLTGFTVTVIEDRPEYEKEFTDVNYILATADTFKDKIYLSRNAYAVICTRGHTGDNEALKFCMDKPFKYIGMIGSTKKVTALYSSLNPDYTQEEIKKVYAPIGLNIASGKPAEIAISIMSEILLIKNGGTPNHKKIL